MVVNWIVLDDTMKMTESILKTLISQIIAKITRIIIIAFKLAQT